ncbi:MAG: hypothetical protein LKJ54_09855 [Acetobacter peroxydans]|jgi:hypothetical protein|nr:hypothetical protein [Acetobacter peroxydans]MCI2078606.1 hypothetical protein [Acetobacter peroxydans]
MSVRVQFPHDTLDALMAAIEVDDVVDDYIALPERIPDSFSQTQLAECLNLCRQLWLEGPPRAELAGLAHRLVGRRDLQPQERAAFKHIRARYKHMGFAFGLYTPAHKRPFLYEATSTLMGEAQDAFRNGYGGRVFLFGVGISVLATPFFDGLRRRTVQMAEVDRADAINQHLRAEIARIPAFLDASGLTGARFHALRKIISRHVAFFDTLRVLYPAEDIYRLARFLSAINGLMGQKHDELVQAALSGTLRYQTDIFPIPDTIRILLEQLCRAYPGLSAAQA